MTFVHAALLAYLLFLPHCGLHDEHVPLYGTGQWSVGYQLPLQRGRRRMLSLFLVNDTRHDDEDSFGWVLWQE
jgi:hypothetical protein